VILELEASLALRPCLAGLPAGGMAGWSACNKPLREIIRNLIRSLLSL